MEKRMLLIVDPQVDFVTGSLKTKYGMLAMENLCRMLMNEGVLRYDEIVVTSDSHPANHCSFTEQGGPFPSHCVAGTHGFELYPSLEEVLKLLGRYCGLRTRRLAKGTNPDREEFSIFQDSFSAEVLDMVLTDQNYTAVDVCGIATDYCVFQTLKDLVSRHPNLKIRVIIDCCAAVDESDTRLEDFCAENGIKIVHTTINQC